MTAGGNCAWWGRSPPSTSPWRWDLAWRAGCSALAAGVALVLAPAAARAQDPGQPVQEGAVEQSCRSLAGGTIGAPDQAPEEPGAGIPPTWPEAPAGLLPARVFLRTATETFNR